MEDELSLSCAVTYWILWEAQSHKECPCHGLALRPMCKDWTMYLLHSHKKTQIGKIRRSGKYVHLNYTTDCNYGNAYGFITPKIKIERKCR